METVAVASRANFLRNMLDDYALTHNSRYLDIGFETLDLKFCESNYENSAYTGRVPEFRGAVLQKRGSRIPESWPASASNHAMHGSNLYGSGGSGSVFPD